MGKIEKQNLFMEHTFPICFLQELLQFSILIIRFEDLYSTMSKNVLCNLITNTGRTLTQKPLLEYGVHFKFD